MTKVKTLTRSDIADAITAEFQVTKFEALEFIHEVLSRLLFRQEGRFLFELPRF